MQFQPLGSTDISSWKLALYPYCLQKGLIQIKEPILIARFKLSNKSSTENIWYEILNVSLRTRMSMQCERNLLQNITCYLQS